MVDFQWNSESSMKQWICGAVYVHEVILCDLLILRLSLTLLCIVVADAEIFWSTP